MCILGIGTAHFAARRCALIHNLTLRYRKGAIRLSMRASKVWKARAAVNQVIQLSLSRSAYRLVRTSAVTQRRIAETVMPIVIIPAGVMRAVPWSETLFPIRSSKVARTSSGSVGTGAIGWSFGIGPSTL